MPVIPSYTGFAATPNLASSYLGGAKLAQEGQQEAARIGIQQQRIAQEASSDAARIAQAAAADAMRVQLAREQLAAKQVENEMELQARQKMLDQQMLQKQQEAKIEASYRNTQIGLADRRLQNAEAMTKMRLEEAARGFQQQQAYERRRAELKAAGWPDREASEQSLRENGFGTSGFYRGFGAREQLDEATKSKKRLLESEIIAKQRSLSSGVMPLLPDKQKQIQQEIDEKRSELEKLLAPSANNPRPVTIPETLTATNAAPAPTGIRGLTVPDNLSTNRGPRIISIRRR